MTTRGIAGFPLPAAAAKHHVEKELHQLNHRHDGHTKEEAQVAAHIAEEGVPL